MHDQNGKDADPLPERAGASTAGQAAWPAVVGVVTVVASTLALLLSGHPLSDALVGGAGIALTGAEVARRVVKDAGLLPTGIVAGVVSVFGSVVYVVGYSFTEVTGAAGVVALVAGELAGRLMDSDRRSRTEV